MRWIIFGALVLWIAGALIDLALGFGRITTGNSNLGRALRPTWTYFANGTLVLIAITTLAWYFYHEQIGNLSTAIIGTLVSLPDVVGMTLRIFRAEQVPTPEDGGELTPTSGT